MIYRHFGNTGGFWMLLRKSQQDLASAMVERTEVLDTALALLFHDDIVAGDEAIERDKAVLDFLASHP